ncbi:MAG: MmgE/PrpD family protein [Clostridia bacterium]|nr:MmgE/PrpD family protein [Clostridia bacterium]
MKFTTDYKLENFIIDAKWENLPTNVRERLKGCFIDLTGALIAGSISPQFNVGLKMAERLFGLGDIAVVGSKKRFNFAGASTAMGHSSNAYDIDDGHNLTRAHPGTSFIGAVLASAYELDVTLKEFLTALLVAYETTIRSGVAIMDYYKYAHSSGTFGAIGSVVGVGKIYGYTKEQLNNVISVAEFNAPLVPGIRSVEYPSMNKDGVPFGVMTGVLALIDSECGFEGNKNLLEAEEYKYLLDDLGEKYHVLDLYFKPYPCCRWAHPAIDAVVEIMTENCLTHNDIEKVTIKTFERATLLSKIEPKTPDEAQYNIAYPVASAVVYGDFGIDRVLEENLTDKTVLDTMKKLSFEVDEEFDKAFPLKRICRAEIITKDGKKLVSEPKEPRGEAHEKVSVSWLTDKFYRITKPVITREKQENIISLILGDENVKIRKIVDYINQ